MISTETTSRIAARYLKAAFFNVGDVILFGKYKNKKGKIVSFSENEKGQPLVEIEPIPKGRKQNKIMGLFKIWNLSVIEKIQKNKEAGVDPLALKVANPFASSIPLGTTWEHGVIRIHRFMDHFRVTDLTNAGKRGKRVRVMTLSPSFYFKGKPADWMESMSKALPDYPSYDRIKSFIKDILVDHPNEIRIDESEERGVDVNPGGTVKIEFQHPTGPSNSIEVEATPTDFRVWTRWKIDNKTKKPDAPANDSPGEMYQDTGYWAANRPGAKVFYNWIQANLEEAKKMDIHDFTKLWHELKIPYNSH